MNRAIALAASDSGQARASGAGRSTLPRQTERAHHSLHGSTKHKGKPMDRLSLWSIGLVALGSGVAVALAADGWTPSRNSVPGNPPAAQASPAATGCAAADAGPQLLP